MHRSTRHWSACTWIACLAILFNAFAPVMSHMASAAPLTVEMEVCTALGMRMMPMSMTPDQADRSASDKLHKSMGHCGYCAVHAATLAIPPLTTALFFLSGGRDVYPPLYYHSPHPLLPWSLAQPRAPPFLV
jgi:hypothetical protein